MSRASSIGENAALSGGLAASATQFGLNTADPGTTGASEVTGGTPAYARVAITWGTPSAGTMLNATSALTVNVPASTTVVYWSSWNTATISGTTGYVMGGALSASQLFSTQGTFTVAIGGLSLTAS
jgi:hypothetical protein